MSKVLVLVIALSGLGSLYGQTAPGYVATVREVKITSSSDNALPGLKDDVFFVKFEAALRNTSDHAIFVSVEPVILAKAEILLQSGEWKTMLTSSWYDAGDQKYVECTTLEPGKTFTFPNVSGHVVLRRDRPANHKATVRFYFYNVCMVGSARRSTDFLTEGIQINH